MRRTWDWIGLAWLLAVGTGWAAVDPAWTTPITPFRITGNLYYVGSRDLAAYLVVTPEGDVLINSNLESSVPQIRRSMKALGFRLTDVKVLLISHAHFDHAAGSAGVKRLTGARYEVMDGDVRTVETGGAADPLFGRGGTHYPPARVDRVLHDGDEVRLGGTVLVAHKTAGHTPGCTTWTMRVTGENGRARDVVIVGSWSVLSEMRLVRRPAMSRSAREHASLPTYPGIAADFARTFRVLEGLPCDVFLGAHGSYFGMLGKLVRERAGESDVWVDPVGYRTALAEKKTEFEQELRRQEAAANKSGVGAKHF